MWHILNSNGFVEFRLFCNEEEAKTVVPLNGSLQWCETKFDWFENGCGFSKGDPPSMHHIFDFATKQWVDSRTPDTEWPLVRVERDRRLLASDWTQLPDIVTGKQIGRAHV